MRMFGCTQAKGRNRKEKKRALIFFYIFQAFKTVVRFFMKNYH